jgi:hypothetical protein
MQGRALLESEYVTPNSIKTSQSRSLINILSMRTPSVIDTNKPNANTLLKARTTRTSRHKDSRIGFRVGI